MDELLKDKLTFYGFCALAVMVSLASLFASSTSHVPIGLFTMSSIASQLVLIFFLLAFLHSNSNLLSKRLGKEIWRWCVFMNIALFATTAIIFYFSEGLEDFYRKPLNILTIITSLYFSFLKLTSE